MWQFLLNWTGTNSGFNQLSTHVYNFVSGFGSDLGEVTLVGMAYHFFASSRCHYGGEGFHGCRRHGKYDFHDSSTGVTYKLCSKHHPTAHRRLTGGLIDKIHKDSLNTKK